MVEKPLDQVEKEAVDYGGPQWQDAQYRSGDIR